MLSNIILIAILISIAAACNAVMDKVSFHYSHSIFANLNELFWNPNLSWKNKYKNGDQEQGERFPFSATALVMFTDAWHLFKSIMITALVTAIIVSIPGIKELWYIGAWLGARLLYAVVFHLFFHIIFENEKRIS